MTHMLAAVAASADHLMNERKRQISGQLPTQRPVVFDRARAVMLGKLRIDVDLEEADGTLIVRFGDGSDHDHHVDSEWAPGDPVWRGSVDGEKISVQIGFVLNGFALSHHGASALARVYTRREADLAALMPERKQEASSKFLLCPMPGVVRSVLVKQGQAVKAGEALCVVEAMKMENVLRAERDATVAALLVEEGASLAVDAPIMSFA
jgi:propionyl-CoA carboxylase alpha chain